MPLALGLVLPEAAYAQGWIKYVNEEDQFIVNFPREPELLEVDYITESGATIPSHIYSVENQEGVAFLGISRWMMARRRNSTKHLTGRFGRTIVRLIKLIKLMPLALGLVLPEAAYAQGWIKYVNEEDQFIVNFPREPELLEVDYITESGATIPSHIYSVENQDSRYAITVVDYTVAEQAPSIAQALDCPSESTTSR